MPLSPDQIEVVLTATVGRLPRRGAQWTAATMAEWSGMPKATVATIWRRYGLRPQRAPSVLVSADVLFLDTVVDLAGLNLGSPECAFALCTHRRRRTDGAGWWSLLGREPDAGHARNGYRLHTLFKACQSATKRVCDPCHHHEPLRTFLANIEASAHPELDLHIVCDPGCGPSIAQLQPWLEHRPRIHTHVASTRASWLSELGRWWVFMADLASRYHGDGTGSTLDKHLNEWMTKTGPYVAPFTWVKSVQRLQESLERHIARGPAR